MLYLQTERRFQIKNMRRPIKSGGVFIFFGLEVNFTRNSTIVIRN